MWCLPRSRPWTVPLSFLHIFHWPTQVTQKWGEGIYTPFTEVGVGEENIFDQYLTCYRHFCALSHSPAPMSTIFYLHVKEQSRYHHLWETFPAIQIWVRYFPYLILSPLYCYDTRYNSYLIICLSGRLQAFRSQDSSLSTSLVSQSVVQNPHHCWMEDTFLSCSSIAFFLVSWNVHREWGFGQVS